MILTENQIKKIERATDYKHIKGNLFVWKDDRASVELYVFEHDGLIWFCHERIIGRDGFNTVSPEPTPIIWFKELADIIGGKNA